MPYVGDRRLGASLAERKDAERNTVGKVRRAMRPLSDTKFPATIENDRRYLSSFDTRRCA